VINNAIQPILEALIGVYIPGPLTMSGLGGLDYGYFARFLLLLCGFYFVFSLFKLTIFRLFGGNL